MALGAATTYQLPARRYSSGTTAATVRESCSLGTKVLGGYFPLPGRFARRGIIRVPMLERALVCLTLSADTSYDGKLPSAGVAQWQSEGLIIPRPWVRFPPPAPFFLLDLKGITRARFSVYPPCTLRCGSGASQVRRTSASNCS